MQLSDDWGVWIIVDQALSENGFYRVAEKERMTMSEEEKGVGAEPVEEPAGAQAQRTVTEEIKVQAQDLFQAINDIIREGTAKRITVVRKGRVLVDIPLAAGIAVSVVLAIYIPFISAMVAVGALLGGCTVRIEREEPPTGA
jgi:Domain of unknown function (DUF4342)